MGADGVAACAPGSRRPGAAVLAGLAVALVTGGCWSRERFERDGVERLCEAASACAGTYDVPSCVSALSAPLDDCAYDPALGADCVAQLDFAACGVADPFGDPILEIPPTCDAAWDCGGVDWLAPVRIE